MRHGLQHKKAKGQSIPLIAIMIVVLVAMVGLSVDVGGVYAEQRSAVRAANAAALSGMNAIIRGKDDASVGQAILQSLNSNGIKASGLNSALSAENRKITAYYYDGSGAPLGGGCNIGTCGGIPTGVSYVQVKIEGYTETYFARMVGRQSLPVNAEAYAAQCAPTSGVYPIMVDYKLLGDSGFLPPSASNEMPYYGLYRDDNLRDGAYQRRIYLKDANTPGSFSWARWQSDQSSGSNTALLEALSGAGSLSDGYDEAPWPTGGGGGKGWPEAAPNGYPIRPHQLNSTDGDWLYANSGLSWSQGNGIEAAIQQHINNRTILILPIVNAETGSGATAQFRVARLGNFLIRGIGKDNGKAYLDMVYLGSTTSESCNNTPPPLISNNKVTITGNIALLPRSREVVTNKLPINYAVVLDTSGSMDWNFMGQAGSASAPKQCGAGPNPDLNARRDADIGSCAGTVLWDTVSERRIYKAKQAALQFIDMMDANDRMQLISFAPAELASQSAPATSQLGDTAGKQALKRAVLLAGTNISNNNCTVSTSLVQSPADCAYKMVGGTPSATGLRKAGQYLSAASTPTKAPDGRTYKKVVVFLTDGVANYYLEPSGNGTYKSNGEPVGWANNAQDQPNCGLRKSEDTNCQVGFASTSTRDPLARPLTAMATQGAELQKESQVYVVALAGVDETGLDQVASNPYEPWLSRDPYGTQIDEIIRAINDNVENGPCQPAPYIGWTYWIKDQNNGSIADREARGITPKLDVYGKVTLKLAGSDAPLYADVVQTAVGGEYRLTYTFTDIPKGTYDISGLVLFKGDDGITRYYNLMRNADLNTSASRSITVTGGGLNGTQVIDPMWLEFNGDVCDPTK